MPGHSVSGDWKEARKTALLARATAVGDTLDHLTDLEEMLTQEAHAAGSGSSGGVDTICRDIRNLSALLRSLRSEYDAEAGRLG